MTQPDDNRPEALKRLDDDLRAFERKRAKPAARQADDNSTAREGYQVIAGLVGGMFGGTGLGWLLDQVAHTKPLGLIGGLLVGMGVSVYSAVRIAGRIGVKSDADPGPPAAPAADDVKD